MHVDVIDTFDDLGRLRANWESIYADDPEAQFFLSWTWIAHWLESTSMRWLILAAKREAGDQNYVAFFPLRLASKLQADGHFHHSLLMAGSYYAVYTGVICHPAHEVPALQAFSKTLLSLNWSELHLDDVFASDERLAALLHCFPASQFVIEKKKRPEHVTDLGEEIDHDVYIVVKLPETWDEFLENRLGAKTRFNARKFLRQVDSGAEYRVSLTNRDTVDRDLEVFLHLWQGRWRSQNPRYASFIASCTPPMIRACLDDGSIFLPILWKGDQPMGAHIALADRQKGMLIGFLGGRDPSFKRPPPGFVLHMYSIRWAIAQGFSTYDLGTGNFSYKYHLGAQEHIVERHIVRTRTGANLHAQLDAITLPAAFQYVERLWRAGRAADAEQGCRLILEFDAHYAPAVQLFEEMNLDTKDAKTLLAQAKKLLRNKELSEAGRFFEAVLAQDSRNFEASHFLGVIRLEQGSAQAAERHLRRAVELGPDNAPAHNNLGSALMALGRATEAIASYEHALALRPNYPQALNNYGTALRQVGRNEEAIGSFAKAVDLSPDFAKAVANHEKALRLQTKLQVG